MLMMDLLEKSSHTHRGPLTSILSIQAEDPNTSLIRVLGEGRRLGSKCTCLVGLTEGTRVDRTGATQGLLGAQSWGMCLGLPSREAEPALPKIAVAICFGSHKNVLSL